MEIREMSIEQIEERQLELNALLETEGADLDSIEAEARSLEERKAELKEIATKKAEEARAVADGAGEVIVERKETNTMADERIITIDSQEYRSAFYNMMANPCDETRAALAALNVDGTNNGTGIAVPTTLDEKIWDNVHSAHPILADINTVRTGIILKVTKHTAITAGKAASKADNVTLDTQEENTFVEVNLVGKDYAKYVQLTYAEAKMSQGAMEDYLAEEIAADIGEALAKDVVTSISTDAQAATAGSSEFVTIANLLAKAEHAVNPVIYCNAANYYALMGAVDTNGQPIFRNGVAIGAQVKIDSAVTTGFICLDPKKFILNVVQDVMVESDKDVKQHAIIVSGYARAEGCMRDNLAASKVTALIAG